MKKFLNKTVQILLDLLVGLAIYFFVTVVFPLDGNTSLLVTLICTAIFAEFFEVKAK